MRRAIAVGWAERREAHRGLQERGGPLFVRPHTHQVKETTTSNRFSNTEGTEITEKMRKNDRAAGRKHSRWRLSNFVYLLRVLCALCVREAVEHSTFLNLMRM